MNIKSLFRLLGLIAIALPSISSACTFTYSHYGDDSIKKRIDKVIGPKVTAEYCNKYNKNYQIVLITHSYMNTERSIAHAIVGLRKRGTKDFPTSNE